MRKNQKVVRCEDKYIANNDDILNFINVKIKSFEEIISKTIIICLLYTSPSPRD